MLNNLVDTYDVGLFGKIGRKIDRVLSRQTRLVHRFVRPSSPLYTVSELKNIEFTKDDVLSEPRINIIIPSLEKTHTYGGISTALAFFEILSIDFKHVRVIVIDFEPTAEALNQYPEYTYSRSDLCEQHKRQIVSIASNKNAISVPSLSVAESDIFIATIWYSAYLAEKARLWQTRFYDSVPKYFAYLIQDYEPGFYAWSSEYLAAESTYRNNNDVLAIFNTSILRNYFHSKGILFSKEYAFEPIIHPKLMQQREVLKGSKKQKIIVVYGRPSTKRNAFSLIIDSLRLWSQNDHNSSDWTVVSAGEDHLDIQLSEELKVCSLGKLSLECYAELMSRASIGISLMVSPHPSYPPIEMAHFGMKVITNAYENKDLSRLHKNIISLDSVSAERIAKNLTRICHQIHTSPSSGWDTVPSIEGYLSNRNPFPFKQAVVNALLQVRST